MNYLEFLHGASDLLQQQAGMNVCSFPDWDSIYAGVDFADERLPEFDDTVGVRRDWFTVQISMRELYALYIEFGWERVAMEVRGFFGGGGGRRGNDYKSRLDEEGKRFYEALRRLRTELAREYRVAAFCIFTNRTLYELCKTRPRTIAELKGVYGIGDRKAAKYGARVLAELYDLTAGQRSRPEDVTGGRTENRTGDGSEDRTAGEVERLVPLLAKSG